MDQWICCHRLYNCRATVAIGQTSSSSTMEKAFAEPGRSNLSSIGTAQSSRDWDCPVYFSPDGHVLIYRAALDALITCSIYALNRHS